MARTMTAAGTTDKDIVQNAYGYGLFTGGLGAHYGAEKIGAAVIPISGGNTQKQIMLMKDFGSTVLCSTPSFCLYIYDVMKQEKIDPKSLKLKIGIFGAEPWTDAMRKEIEKMMHIKAIDIFGLSEITGPGVSFECAEAQNGLHVNEDYFYPEIIDPATGQRGFRYEGVIDWPGQIEALARDGYPGFVSIEPHERPKIALARRYVERLRGAGVHP